MALLSFLDPPAVEPDAVLPPELQEELYGDSDDDWEIDYTATPNPGAPSFASDEFSEDEAKGELLEKFKSRRWRLDNLYYIVGEDPQTKKLKRIKFKMNWAQRWLLDHLWFLNIILKARQLGFTTFICILFLDTALFRDDTHCGIVAHNREDAEEFFTNKIRYAYDQLPQWLQDARSAPSDSTKKLAFSNGSSIRVGTSLRSGTFYMLHISEFGKICARFPEKAREIVTGSINTVHPGSFIFIESTAEGRSGYFYEFCEAAKKMMLLGKTLNQLQFKFFFFPWWRDPKYQLDPSNVVITTEMQKYFDQLEAQGIRLSDAQKAWYVTKAETQRDDMMREFPSTPAEAFQASVVGSYYATEMTKMRKDRRITKVPYDPMYPVNTFWDIGFNDSMAIWFHQRVGNRNRIIDYVEDSGEGLAYYVRILLKEKPYVYGTHYMPHDANNGSAQTGETFETYARGLGLRDIFVVPRARNADEVLKGIEAVRMFLGTTEIDEERCDKGIKCLDNYRKSWDEKLQEYRRTPLHDWASNGADAMRCGAVAFKENIRVAAEDLVPEYAEDF